MIQKLKQKVLQLRLDRADAKYRAEYEYQKYPYRNLLKEADGKGDRRYHTLSTVRQGKIQILPVTYVQIADAIIDPERPLNLPVGNETWMVILEEEEKTLFSHDFETCLEAEQGNGSVIYWDEDLYSGEKTEKETHHMKPDMSLQTLYSFFYLGSCFAVEGKLFRQAMDEVAAWDFWKKVHRSDNRRGRMAVYALALHLAGQQEFVHISRILSHQRDEMPFWGMEEEYARLKQAFFLQNGIRASCKKIGYENWQSVVFDVPASDRPSVSIIIPSKDHPDVLRTCVSSIRNHTADMKPEVIVIDNGSSEENKEIILRLAQEWEFTYLYEPMEFDFSRMNNLAAHRAKGEYLLLCNDDIEVPAASSDWLCRLLGQAMQPGIGAVGAKLLYPQGKGIQHAGISSIGYEVGPAHKLLGWSDDQDYYFGRNHLTYNVIGVTAACLMVRKDIYEQADGMPETMKVAYNDVSFCYRLISDGYQNVQRNDVVLIHHESLSRGDDRMDEKKWERLLIEKEILYRDFPQLCRRDPYYNDNLTTNQDSFVCRHHYPYEDRGQLSSVKIKNAPIDETWRNNCLNVTVEHAVWDKKMHKAESEHFWIEGWWYVLGMDNARYRVTVVLTSQETKQQRFVSVFPRYRKDVEEILEQKNVGLSGFVCRIRKEDLPAGNYRIGLLAKDRCSRQILFKEQEEIMTIEERSQQCQQ